MSANNQQQYVKKPLPESLRKNALITMAVGLAAGSLAYVLDGHHAPFGYLTGFMLLVSIGVGSLFLFALEYAGGAEWSTPVRRVFEFGASVVPFLFLLVIPLLFSLGTLFHWTHEEAVKVDKILTAKSPYLNVTFFLIRTGVFMLLWFLFYYFMSRNSRKQDETKDQALTTKNIRFGVLFIPVFAISITFIAIDWMMSLEPHWFSTIFGVYFFAGTVLAGLSVGTYAVVRLREGGYLHPAMIDDHYYSLGALLFAFVNFWAYIAFSQYLLIWYANLPEETFWMLNRWQGNWIWFSLLLIITHFVVPYAVLLSQPAKMNAKKLKFMAVWILAAHYIDIYWLVMPSVPAGSSFLVYILELGFPAAAIGLVMLLFYYNSRKHNLVPVGDPKLQKGLKFRL